MQKKLKLYGFNNLTKSLSFNIYDICYAKTPKQKLEYIDYIDELYNSERLTQILQNVTNIIGAHVLNVACQDYDPHGASVTILIAEHELEGNADLAQASPGPLPESLVAHLDKSHVTVHTYPESHPVNGISTFRLDIDVATCGMISPLKALNYLIHSFDSDIVTMDYRIRGFTRETNGGKIFADHEINSIQDFLTEETRNAYQMIDVNIYQESIFHTKMLLKDFNLDNYLFGITKDDLSPEESEAITKGLKREMLEIFYSRNLN